MQGVPRDRGGSRRAGDSSCAAVSCLASSPWPRQCSRSWLGAVRNPGHGRNVAVQPWMRAVLCWVLQLSGALEALTEQAQPLWGHWKQSSRGRGSVAPQAMGFLPVMAKSGTVMN